MALFRLFYNYNVFDFSDSILEPNITNEATAFFQSSENVTDLLNYLITNYVGAVEHIRILQDLYEEFAQSDSEPVLQETAKNMVLQKYDNAKVEASLMQNRQACCRSKYPLFLPHLFPKSYSFTFQSP